MQLLRSVNVRRQRMKKKEIKNKSLSTEEIHKLFYKKFATKYLGDDRPYQFISLDKESKFNLLSNIEITHNMRFTLDALFAQMSSSVLPEKEKIIEKYLSKIILELTDEPLNNCGGDA